MRWTAVLAVGVMLLVPPVAADEPVHIALDVATASASMQGSWNLSAQISGIVSDPEVPGLGGQTFVDGTWSFQVFDAPRTAFHHPTEPYTLYAQDEDEELVAWHNGTGTLRLESFREDAQVRILSASYEGELDLDVEGVGRLHADKAPLAYQVVLDDSRSKRHPEFDRPAWPSPGYAQLTGDTPRNLTLEDPVLVYIYDADVVLPSGKRISLGPQQEAIDGKPGANPVVAERSHRYFAVLRGEGLGVELGPANWLWLTMSMFGGAQGDFELLNADGEIRVMGEEHRPDTHILQVIGDFEVSWSHREDRQRWKLDGSATFVGIDGLTVAGSRDHTAEVIAATTLVALALAALWKLVPRIFALVGWSRDVFGNPHRVQIARLVTWEPGLSPMGLARRIGLGRTSVLRHLYRLEREGYVSKYGKGKVPSYALNSGSSRFPVGDGEARAEEVFQALQHPIRRDILEATGDRPVDYEGFCRFLAKRELEPVARATFSRHAKEMTMAGILKRARIQGRAVWTRVLDLNHVRVHYVRAFLVQRHAWPVYNALKAPINEDELKRRHGSTVMRVLRELEALGLATRRDGLWRGVPV